MFHQLALMKCYIIQFYLFLFWSWSCQTILDYMFIIVPDMTWFGEKSNLSAYICAVCLPAPLVFLIFRLLLLSTKLNHYR